MTKVTSRKEDYPFHHLLEQFPTVTSQRELGSIHETHRVLAVSVEVIPRFSGRVCGNRMSGTHDKITGCAMESSS